MKSSKMLSLLLISSCLLFTLACKKEDTRPNKSDSLKITIQDKFETPPSRVSIFFQVETENGEPVSGLTEDNFTIFEKGRNDDKELRLSKDEATRVISDNGQVFSYYNMLLLDLSGSVLNSNLDQVKTSASSFIDDLMDANGNSSSKVGIWWFDGRDELHSLMPFSDDRQALKAAIAGIEPSISTDNSTDLFGAVLKSVAMAEARLLQSELQGILSAVSVTIFTDGTDQAARYSKVDAFKAVETAPQGIHFYTIGLGNEIDETVLGRLGKSSSVFADNTAALSQKFEEIANLILNQANSFYLFEYCTPKRNGSGISDLHIRIDTETGVGLKITSFDATGFTDDCDLD